MIRAYLLGCGVFVGLCLYIIGVALVADGVENATGSTPLGVVAMLGCYFVTGLIIAVVLERRRSR